MGAVQCRHRKFTEYPSKHEPSGYGKCSSRVSSRNSSAHSDKECTRHNHQDTVPSCATSYGDGMRIPLPCRRVPEARTRPAGLSASAPSARRWARDPALERALAFVAAGSQELAPGPAPGTELALAPARNQHPVVKARPGLHPVRPRRQRLAPRLPQQASPGRRRPIPSNAVFLRTTGSRLRNPQS